MAVGKSVGAGWYFLKMPTYARAEKNPVWYGPFSSEKVAQLFAAKHYLEQGYPLLEDAVLAGSYYNPSLIADRARQGVTVIPPTVNFYAANEAAYSTDSPREMGYTSVRFLHPKKAAYWKLDRLPKGTVPPGRQNALMMALDDVDLWRVPMKWQEAVDRVEKDMVQYEVEEYDGSGFDEESDS